MKAKKSLTHRVDTEAERQILERILSDEFPVGMRLPNTAELANQLDLGTNSVQQALARLSAKGYLERKPRLGTFVRRRDENSSSVIILVGPDLMKEPHYMDRRLTACLEKELNAAGYLTHIHDNLISTMDPQSPSRRGRINKLIRDFTMYAPVGVIESTMTLKRIQELSNVFELPSVSIKAPFYGGDIHADHAAFIEEALEYLVASKRKRVVWVLKVPGRVQDSHRFEQFWDAIRSSKLDCARIIEIDDQDPSRNPEEVVSERIKKFLYENRALPPAKRADCLLVDEDILMRGVSVALLGEQAQIPEELLVLSHTNEDIDHHYGVPVIRYENPISQLAREAVQLLTSRVERSPDPSLPIAVPGRIIDNTISAESLVIS